LAGSNATECERKELSLTGTYPKAACLKQLKGTAIYNVLVDGNGKSTNLDLIRSAGYPIFNDQARQQINSHSFEKAGEPRFTKCLSTLNTTKKFVPL
jgi:TonB family protein